MQSIYLLDDCKSTQNKTKSKTKLKTQLESDNNNNNISLTPLCKRRISNQTTTREKTEQYQKHQNLNSK